VRATVDLPVPARPFSQKTDRPDRPEWTQASISASNWTLVPRRQVSTFKSYASQLADATGLSLESSSAGMTCQTSLRA
jgi:hypothetical protein